MIAMITYIVIPAWFIGLVTGMLMQREINQITIKSE
jgi:hypothetical protein